MIKKLKVPNPISAGVMLTYRCTAACRHCMYACSSEWENHWISEEDLKILLYQLAGTIKPSPLGENAVSLNHGIHFTGGEPFLNFELLLRAVEIADEFRIPSTFVETNCFWCSDDERTRERLELLKARGLTGILISVNPFYTEYVPFQRTERCIKISKEVFGQNVMVYQSEYYHQFKQLGIKERLSIDDYLQLTGVEDLRGRVELFLMGKAARTLKEFYSHQPASSFFNEPCRPSFLRNWHNHFDNYGNFLPGYCGGISLGDWHNLIELTEEGIDLEGYPVLRFLIEEDMEGLFRFADKLGYPEREEGYISKCDLCLDIRNYLISRQDFEELQPEEFYGHL